jgi:glycosyltransferase involved in cell wall biosynthesis
MTTPLISIVVPVYNEEESLPIFFATIIPVLDNIDPNWEIVCVNDGSRDNTLEVVRAKHAEDPRVKLVSFSRNFGKEAALTAGIAYTTGQAVIPIDADLQDPPELIPEMIAKWREGYKVVLATRRLRSGDGFLKKYTALSFYWVIDAMSHNNIPKNTGDFRLMDRVAVEALKQLPERTRFMKGLLSWVGFKTTQVFYDRPDRAAGETSFNFFSLWKLALDGVFSFSTIPLKIWTYLGACISLLSFIYAIFLIIRTLLGGTDLPGYTSLMVAVLFMGGIQLMSLGIVGEYVGRIYRETKRRPLYIVEEALGAKDQHA